MSEVALIIIYNHQYNDNIDILERIYEHKFSDIYHLVPFYNGTKPNVIAVYENSFYFQGYVSQGFKSFFNAKYKHYLFAADDMILNPEINERNYNVHFKLNANTCFIPGFINLGKSPWWKRGFQAYLWDINIPGVEAKGQLPDKNEATQSFNNFGLEIHPLNIDQIYKKKKFPKQYNIKEFRAYASSHFHRFKNRNKTFNLNYPLVGSYSDVFVVSSDAIKMFCHYSGVFASTKLFVELAIPTAIVLAGQDIVTEDDLQLKGRALWGKNIDQELNVYEYSLKRLLTDFPSNNLYLHPIKLSKWNTDL